MSCIVAGFSLLAAGLQAATFTYSRTASNSAGTPTSWNAITSWTAKPVSAVDTTLNFTGTLGAGTTIFTLNDIGGTGGPAGPNFRVNRMNFTEAGPASGAVPTITVSGNPLEFISNGGTLPTLEFNTSNTVKPTVTIASNLVLTNNLAVTATSDATLSGEATGGGAITKSGLGTLTLSGANSYTGATNIEAGILVLANSSALGSTSGITLTAGASLGISGGITIGEGKSITLNGLGVGNTGALRSSSAGTNTWAGTVNLGTTGGAGTPNMPRIGATLGVMNVSGVIQNGSTTGLVVRSPFDAMNVPTGSVTFSGANTYTGITHIVVGNLSVSSLNRVVGGTASSNLGAPVTAEDGTIYFSSGVAPQGQLTYTGTGETTDRNILLFGSTSGAVLEQAGTGLLKFTGTVTAPGAAALDQRKTLTLQGSTAGTGEIAGVISDSVLGTAGQLATSIAKNDSGMWTLSGANTFTGKTTVNAGTLSVSSINSVVGGTATSSLGAPVTVTNGTIALGSGTSTGTLRYTGTGETTDRVIHLAGTTGGGGSIDQSGGGLLKFTSSMTAASGAQTLTLRGTGNGEFAGLIRNDLGVVNLMKADAGTWTLASGNTYTGGTTVNGGTLLVKNTSSSATGTGDTTIGAAGTLAGHGTAGATGKMTTINGKLVVGDTGGVNPGTLSILGNLNLASAATATFEITGLEVTEYDRLVVGQTFTLGGVINLNFEGFDSSNFANDFSVDFLDWTSVVSPGFDSSYISFQNVDTGGNTGSWSFTNFLDSGSAGGVTHWQAGAVPEPARAVLMLLGMAGLLLRRRR